MATDNDFELFKALGVTAAPYILRWASIPAMLAVAGGGYAYKKYSEQKDTNSEMPAKTSKVPATARLSNSAIPLRCDAATHFDPFGDWLGFYFTNGIFHSQGISNSAELLIDFVRTASENLASGSRVCCTRFTQACDILGKVSKTCKPSLRRSIIEPRSKSRETRPALQGRNTIKQRSPGRPRTLCRLPGWREF